MAFPQTSRSTRLLEEYKPDIVWFEQNIKLKYYAIYINNRNFQIGSRRVIILVTNSIFKETEISTTMEAISVKANTTSNLQLIFT